MGHVVSVEKIACDPDKLEAVVDWPIPETLTQLRVCLEFTSYYRGFIKEISRKAAPLIALTETDRKYD